MGLALKKIKLAKTASLTTQAAFTSFKNMK